MNNIPDEYAGVVNKAEAALSTSYEMTNIKQDYNPDRVDILESIKGSLEGVIGDMKTIPEVVARGCQHISNICKATKREYETITTELELFSRAQAAVKFV